MKNKNFVRILTGLIIVSVLLVFFRQSKPEAIQNIVSTTHQQIRSFKDTFREESKTLEVDEVYLSSLGFIPNPRIYPTDIWRNTSLPVIVTYVLDGLESQTVGLINNIGRILPNNTILVYNLGVGTYALKTLLNYCNSSRCQVFTFNLEEFPSHVEDESIKAFRPLVIQDALHRTGAIFFLEPNYRVTRHFTSEIFRDLFEKEVLKANGILTWPISSKNPVSSLTHKNMFHYFRTDSENFLFIQMVRSEVLIMVNTESVHREIMLPWCKCALLRECIVPIGAQSGGCRFDKKPQYRYSGCHGYDTSALNIILGLKFNMDTNKYVCQRYERFFETVELSKAEAILRELEQNITTEGRLLSFES